MDIRYFNYSNWAKGTRGSSLRRGFKPLIDIIEQTETVHHFNVPHDGSLPWNMLKNIMYVHKHRTKTGINHITGDIHYCMLGLIGCKSVLTIHDDYAIAKAHRGPLDKIFKRIFWLYIPIKIASVTVFISQTTAESISKYVNLKKRNTIVFSHHSLFADYKYFHKEFSNDCPVILQVGSDPQKNLETTMKAIARTGRKCRLRVIRKMTAEQHALAKSLNLDYSNTYDITDEQMLEEYRRADIVTFPSLFEGFGLPVLEGQAIGRPVITSDRAPMNVVCGGEESALLLSDPQDVDEYAEKLTRLMDDAELRQTLVANGLKNARKYSAENAAKKYMEIYKSI